MEVKDYDVELRFDGSHGLKEQDWDEQYVEEEQDGGGLWENGSWVGRLELENERRRDSQIWSLRFDSDNYTVLAYYHPYYNSRNCRVACITRAPGSDISQHPESSDRTENAAPAISELK